MLNEIKEVEGMRWPESVEELVEECKGRDERSWHCKGKDCPFDIFCAKMEDQGIEWCVGRPWLEETIERVRKVLALSRMGLWK